MLTMWLLLLAAAQPRQTVTWSQVDGADPRILARLLLPPGDADEVAGGKVHRLWVPGQSYRAILWTQPKPTADGLCHRTARSIGLGNRNRLDSEAPQPDTILSVAVEARVEQFAAPYPEKPSVAACTRTGGYVTPSVQTRAASLAAMKRLTRAMRMAAGRRSTGFSIVCQIELKGLQSCPDARRALATLPLNALYSVEPAGSVKTTVVMDGPGPKLLSYEFSYPVLDSRPRDVEFSFGPSAPDGNSWRVGMSYLNGRLVRVSMRKASVIYH